MISMAVAISPRDVAMVRPLSSVSSSASSSMCSSMSVANRRRSAPRSAGPIRDHGPSSNAVCAARTASSTSAASPSATVARTFPVAGLTVSNVLPDLAGTRWFPMSRAGGNEASHWFICGLRACPGMAVLVVSAVMVRAPQISPWAVFAGPQKDVMTMRLIAGSPSVA